MIGGIAMVLLITGTIKPASGVPSLTLTDSDERLKQYISSIEYFLLKTSINEIVFCDNSNCSEGCFADLYLLAKRMNKKIEILSFKGNNKKVSVKGKGYGEGEIIEYAMNNSSLIKNSSFFMKITGRLVVENINDIVARLNPTVFYINMFNKIRVDTRLYAMPVEFYRKWFLDAKEYVCDAEGYYIEHVFTDIIRKNKVCCRNFPKYPRYIGKSGSTGREYTYSKVKCYMKDFLSIFNFYGVKGYEDS